MRVLVIHASKHGGTEEIAARVAARLNASGLQVELRRIGDPADMRAFDAFVVGSSIYMGHWNRDAVSFVRENRVVLASRPVWLFSSGPIGTQPKVPPSELPELQLLVGSDRHIVFGGVLKPDELSAGARLIARLMRASGDSRDWAEIDAWADGVVADMNRRAPVSARAI